MKNLIFVLVGLLVVVLGIVGCHKREDYVSQQKVQERREIALSIPGISIVQDPIYGSYISVSDEKAFDALEEFILANFEGQSPRSIWADAAGFTSYATILRVRMVELTLQMETEVNEIILSKLQVKFDDIESEYIALGPPRDFLNPQGYFMFKGVLYKVGAKESQELAKDGSVVRTIPTWTENFETTKASTCATATSITPSYTYYGNCGSNYSGNYVYDRRFQGSLNNSSWLFGFRSYLWAWSKAHYRDCGTSTWRNNFYVDRIRQVADLRYRIGSGSWLTTTALNSVSNNYYLEVTYASSSFSSICVDGSRGLVTHEVTKANEIKQTISTRLQ